MTLERRHYACARRALLTVCAVLSIGLGWPTPSGAAPAERPTLQHDMFSRPAIGPAGAPATVGASGTAVAAPTGASAASAGVMATPAWRPALRAVVVAGRRSMVLIDASVIEMGGQLDGYRLDAVHEDGAVFVKGRQRVTLLLDRNKEYE